MDLDRKPPVRRTMPPSESVVASWYENASLLDSYSIALSAWERSSMRELATRKLVNPPAWQKALIALRDAMVTPFGIKTSDTVRTSWDSHERVDFFPVHWEGKDEILLGTDDRHLDFRLSLLRRHSPNGTLLIATTVVPTHNALGSLSQRDQAFSSPRGQGQPRTLCTNTTSVARVVIRPGNDDRR